MRRIRVGVCCIRGAKGLRGRKPYVLALNGFLGNGCMDSHTQSLHDVVAQIKSSCF